MRRRRALNELVGGLSQVLVGRLQNAEPPRSYARKPLMLGVLHVFNIVRLHPSQAQAQPLALRQLPSECFNALIDPLIA